MPREQNPLDRLADNLAEWIDSVSDQMAEALIGGMTAPFAPQLSEQEKLEYYTRQFFEPDGSPNMQGRAQEMERLGPVQFAETLKTVLAAHPELRSEPQRLVPGFRGPDGLPGTDIAPDGLPRTGAPVAEPTQSIPMPTGPIAPDGLPTRA